MKTADLILANKILSRGCLQNVTRDIIIEAMKEYADECAREALRLASENATIIEGECGEFGDYIPTVVDKESILNESNLPKHI